MSESENFKREVIFLKDGSGRIIDYADISVFRDKYLYEQMISRVANTKKQLELEKEAAETKVVKLQHQLDRCIYLLAYVLYESKLDNGDYEADEKYAQLKEFIESVLSDNTLNLNELPTDYKSILSKLGVFEL